MALKRLLLLFLPLISLSLSGQVKETYPKFPGGFNAFKIYLATSLNYPESARKSKYQGTTGIIFNVNPDGTGSLISLDFGKMNFEEAPGEVDKQLLTELQGDIRKEVERILAEMPAWEPATRNGEKLKVRIGVPLKMALY